MHQSRISYEQFMSIAPAAYQGLLVTGKAVDDSGLEKTLTELIKIRASQINACAFCLQYHLNLARKLGISAEKLDLLAVWREAGVYSAREMAALAWTEALTHIAGGAAGDQTLYQSVREQFSDSELVFLTVAIGAINQWNRIAGALHFAPPVSRAMA